MGADMAMRTRMLPSPRVRWVTQDRIDCMIDRMSVEPEKCGGMAPTMSLLDEGRNRQGRMLFSLYPERDCAH